ncbi:MAG: hypothetical protein ABR922_10000 [Streptosporangiaceae bacterium]
MRSTVRDHPTAGFALTLAAPPPGVADALDQAIAELASFPR